MPAVPTFGELKMNLGDIEDAEMWYGFLAPGRTPPTVVKSLNAMLVEALEGSAVRELLQSLDVEVMTSTPEEFASLIRADYERWGRVIRSTGFTLSE
jgi:tripartite-type tricarboxylate transporter receptor subunit TctC